ncbi:MAG: hypothetical protein GY727_01820 [Gammaproteobacteria bacterium]|nr:hypothetical protein [Gammaproteobacteria bacterium]
MFTEENILYIGEMPQIIRSAIQSMPYGETKQLVELLVENDGWSWMNIH